MRIAIIYSGYLRLWERMLKPNKKYLFTSETDLFFYTYDEPIGYTYKQFIKIGSADKDDLFYGRAYYDEVKNLYEANQSFNIDRQANILQQWHNNFISFCLVPTDYDVYVRSRGDVILNGKIDFHKYSYPHNRIYIPQSIDWGGVNDQFAFGGYRAMKVYYSLYIEYFKRNGYLVPLYPEHSLLEHMLLNGIEIERIDVEHQIER